jgi:hypothetical protein
MNPSEESQRLVVTTIINVDYLPRLPEAVHDAVDFRIQALQEEFLVVNRDDDGNNAELSLDC